MHDIITPIVIRPGTRKSIYRVPFTVRGFISELLFAMRILPSPMILLSFRYVNSASEFIGSKWYSTEPFNPMRSTLIVPLLRVSLPHPISDHRTRIWNFQAFHLLLYTSIASLPFFQRGSFHNYSEGSQLLPYYLIRYQIFHYYL